ncbi:arginine repressor [Cohnella sp. CIP 111063]|jgi:transcriptional regulator of arginine metabolism|uniref:transcriptional regulator AhrC/ArgR n=1 Tax=unclassified Cohnella TaxID=2636738 RepID=UPI000B8BFF60|nr:MULTISPECIES: transcriptional regulator ArgR [unclassified Cohnella]OXS52410.1 arginine repressor [Cohnella sp. CIP 111063]PRX58268.1 ArgR family transcriptional regulator [Cohnella sp. SGD-V74]
MKGQRQRKIRELIGSREVETQEELVEALGLEGMQVTQATVSRDIKEMQLIKVPLEDGRYKYSMPQDQRYNPAQKLKRALLDHYLGAESAENLVVLKCLPGTAGTIAALIDGMDWPEIIGTIGGDDTTLIITKTKSLGEDVLKRINDIML